MTNIEDYVLLNRGKEKKFEDCRAFYHFLSLIHNQFNKSNNTGACMLDFIYIPSSVAQ